MSKTGAFTLTRLEAAVLHFMKHPREVFSAEKLTDTVLFGADGRTRTADVIHAHIRHPRENLEADPKSPAWIKAMGRRDYFFAG